MGELRSVKKEEREREREGQRERERQRERECERNSFPLRGSFKSGGGGGWG
jgi:hypothetical protein